MASFSPSMKHKLNSLKSRIMITESASPFVLAAFSAPKTAIVESLHRAFVTMCTMTIDYRDEHSTLTQRMIEPHYLLLSYPVWYVLAWDHLRDDVRTFRCDRIIKVQVHDQGFRLRPLARFSAATEGVDAIQP